MTERERLIELIKTVPYGSQTLGEYCVDDDHPTEKGGVQE